MPLFRCAARDRHGREARQLKRRSETGENRICPTTVPRSSATNEITGRACYLREESIYVLLDVIIFFPASLFRQVMNAYATAATTPPIMGMLIPSDNGR